MMSLPPPAAKPTMRWIALLGYFDGSSCARAGAASPRIPGARSPTHAPIREYRLGVLIKIDPFNMTDNSEPCDMNMQYGGLAVIKRRKRPIDGGGEFVGFGNAFAMGAERLCDFRKIPPVALTARHQARLELVGLGRNALRINPLHRGFHRLPAAIIKHDGQDRYLILLRYRIDAVGRGEVKSAVTDHLHDAASRLREF